MLQLQRRFKEMRQVFKCKFKTLTNYLVIYEAEKFPLEITETTRCKLCNGTDDDDAFEHFSFAFGLLFEGEIIAFPLLFRPANINVQVQILRNFNECTHISSALCQRNGDHFEMAH